MKVIAWLQARGIGSSLKNKNIRPVLGKPMIWWTLTEAKKTGFIDEIFVWTEDKQIATIVEECGCRVIPRVKSEIFYHSSYFDAPDIFGKMNDHIQSICGTLGDFRIYLNCNLFLMTASVLKGMFDLLLSDDTAKAVSPVSEINRDLFLKASSDGPLFPVFSNTQTIAANRQFMPELYQFSGICISDFRPQKEKTTKTVYYEVAPEYLLDAHDLDDIKLGEFYLMKRMGGRIIYPHGTDACIEAACETN